ncbi:methylglyoxal synthase [Paraglaciecola aquimarina]|uniref:Methylglyoxal synthase n=1 Tax=Paraglaciecola algarum TaxID=3050085 RepID=A0ABS9DC10_9ALTE|nr:methylglyoxal synthase [Paraglaciecola sp. G1-23]MCF2949329.1 methylglyoxal synthase [Paraglaciecola sp. G1-23]
MQKTIALVAHDHKKPDLIKWALSHKAELCKHKLVATGTTGGLLQKELNLDIHRFKSGPLGGDQQIGALIAEQKLDCLIFFWDPLNPAPHDPDVKALLRLCSVWNLPVACTTSTADMIVTSPLFIGDDYQRDIPDL